MFSTKVKPVILATLLAFLATGLLIAYINSVKAALVESGKKRPVLVAVSDIAAGTSGAEISRQNLAKEELIPAKYLSKDTLSHLSDITNKVLLLPVTAGQPLTKTLFKPVAGSNLAYRMKPGQVALTVALTDADSVNGHIRPGDKVLVLAVLEPGAGGQDISRVLLKNITVLAVSNSNKDSLGSVSAKQAITLSLLPAEAEKIALAEQKGKLKLAIQADENIPATSGQSLETLWR